MADEKIEIEIVLDDGQVKKGFAKIQKQSKKTGDSIAKNLGARAAGFAKLGAAAGAAAAAIAAVFAKKTADLASQQDQAVRQLNIALANAGQFSRETSQGLQEFASSLQDATGVGDELILQQAALASAFGFTGKQLELATEAALDLSVAAGINLEEATRRIGRTISGSIEDVSKFAPEIKNLSKEQLAAGQAAEILAKTLAGTAANAADGYEGSIRKLGSSFGDTLEQFGKFITQSPALSTAIEEIAKLFDGLTDDLKGVNTDFAKDFIITFSTIAQAGVFTANRLEQVFVLAALRAQQAWQAFRVGLTLGLAEGSNQALVDTNNQIDELLNKDLNESPTIQFFDRLIEKVSATNGKLKEFGDGLVNNAAKASETLPTFADVVDVTTNQFDALEEQTKLTQKQIAEANKTVQKDFKSIGTAARQGLGRGVGQAFAAFGRALAEGENAFEAFTKALIASIGQGAIALGTEFILRGIAYSFVPGLQGLGPPLIAAGAALAAFGGVLSAVGGGGGESAGGGGGGVGAGATAEGPPVTDLGESVEEFEEPVTKVNIELTGAVIDPVESGNKIAEILNESFRAGGTRVEAV